MCEGCAEGPVGQRDPPKPAAPKHIVMGSGVALLFESVAKDAGTLLDVILVFVRLAQCFRTLCSFVCPSSVAERQIATASSQHSHAIPAKTGRVLKDPAFSPDVFVGWGASHHRALPAKARKLTPSILGVPSGLP